MNRDKLNTSALLNRGDPTTTVEEITPEIAKEMLLRNDMNRRPKPNAIAAYARAMAEGKWKLNGESIVLSPNGRLLNGQNRLMACIKADVAFRTNVVRGVHESTFDTFDQQSKRAAGDILAIAGVPNANRVAAILRMIVMLERGANRGGMVVTPTEIEDALIRHPAAEFVASESMKSSGKLILDGPISAVIVLAYERHREHALRFMRDISEGANLASDSPALILRNRLFAERGSGTSLSTYIKFGLAIRAWNAYVMNRPLKVLKFAFDNEIPEIL